MTKVTYRTTCRACVGELTELFHLGTQYISDFPKTTVAQEEPVPLTLMQCLVCDLVQLSHTVDRERLYREYWYRSNTNETMRRELAGIVEEALMQVVIHPDDWVLDIGANDGTLLSFYDGGLRGMVQRCGVDPAKNLSRELAENADLVIPTFFPTPDPLPFKAKIITAIAMVYDLEEPMEFLRAVARTLHPEGVFVLQFGDLLSMVEGGAWDGICHEHLEYYSFSVMERLLYQVGLVVVKAERNATNGGSTRIFAKHGPFHDGDTSGRDLRYHETAALTPEALNAMAVQITLGRRQVLHYLQELKAAEKVVDVYGASTKGNTLLQTWGLDHRVIRRAIERDPHKFGRFTTGTWIPIVSEEDGRRDPPEVMLVLPWHFQEAIMNREKAYLDSGGKLLFPLPRPQVVGSLLRWNLVSVS